MLLESHNLEGIIAELLHTWKYVLAELIKSTDLLLLAGHAYVALIDERILPFRHERVLPYIWFGVPHLSAENFGYGILYTAAHIGRKTLSASTRPLDVELVELAMCKEMFGNMQFPVAVAHRMEFPCGIPFPAVEITYHEDLAGIWSILTEHPISILSDVETVIKMVVDLFCEAAVHI